jgi:hypothetical protein
MSGSENRNKGIWKHDCERYLSPLNIGVEYSRALPNCIHSLRDQRVHRSAAVGVEAEEVEHVSCARIFWTAASPPIRNQYKALLVYVKWCNDTYWRSFDTTSNMCVWGVRSIRTDIPSKQVATVQITPEIVIRCKVLTSVVHDIQMEMKCDSACARVYF